MATLEPGTYLLAGPAFTGKLDLLIEYLVADPRRPPLGVAISTNKRAEAIRRRIRQRLAAGHAPQVGGQGAEAVRGCSVIDCVSDVRATFEPGQGIGHAGSPGQLFDLSTQLADELRRRQDSGRPPVRVAYHSLSTALIYAEVDAVCRFVGRVQRMLHSVGATGLFAIDPGAHDEETVDRLASIGDGTLHVRRTGSIEVRGPEVPAAPTSWSPIRQLQADPIRQ